MAERDDSAPSSHSEPALRWSNDCAWVALTAIVMGAIVLFLWRPAARLDFYFDEMWRVEQVRSTNPINAYFEGSMPIPPGWVTSLSMVFDMIPARRPVLRLVAASVAIPAGMIFVVALRRLLERILDRQRAWAAAVLAGATTFLTPGLAQHGAYFNNYVTDVAVAAAIIWALIAIDDNPEAAFPWWALVAIAVGAPWFAQGALFLFPGAAVIVFLHRRTKPWLAGAVAVSALVSTTVVARFFLLPVSNNADNTNSMLVEYWRPETPAIGIRDFLRRYIASMVEAVSPAWTDGRPLAAGAILGFAVIGAVVIHRAWSWWLPIFGLAQLLAVAAAVAAGWPATFVRNNSSFQLLIAALAPIGMAISIMISLGWIRSRTRSFTTTVAAGMLVLTAVLIWLPRTIVANAASTDVFARGMSDDASFVAANAGSGDLAVAYHLAGPYLRDRLLNFSGADPGIRVIDEAREGRGELSYLDEWVSDGTETIWCFVPFEAGPEATANSCRLRDARWAHVATTSGQRATIVEMQLER